MEFTAGSKEVALRIRSTGAQLYQLKVTLAGIRPSVWREFLVPRDISLKRLHDSLQMVMGWTDSHLHQFNRDGVIYGTSDPDSGLRCVSENTTKLDAVLRKPGDRLTYEYDFGDSWEHEVRLEKVLEPTGPGFFPVILAGRRACPPEDVGGVPGYYHFLEVLADPKHPAHADMLEWVGDSFDPEAYDAKRANLELHGGWVRDGRGE